MTILIEDLTDGSINGDGTFDKLMTSVTEHVERQYKNSRITGADYANVYLGSLTAVLSQASNFLLQSKQLDKQLELLDKQILNVDANTSLVNAQIDKLEADTAISVKQLELITSQIAESQANVDATRANIELINQQKLNAENQFILITKQQEKVDKENALLEQKLVTEIAQTEGDETTVGGVLGKQMELVKKQSEGFDRNAEQKLAKMMIDTWTVRQTTDGADTLNNGLGDTEINNVLNIAKQGIGAPTFTP